MTSLTPFQSRSSSINDQLILSASTSARAPSLPTLLKSRYSTSNDKLFLSA
eukprot:CAMPEP_0198319012 /NCGR_PEP_ID=MMETSP1450-20131203/8247_1 /TAXON_ID=753684 ORGANISM="Madagascaria erythrocladiodes, Strain CCMP3234" /NCGR_SAMPLE_ID=MMETSP1450 /ASSEMBLY_ACC=CAM_ASM_001115 /LENGTH=50 /DNA_ID=CAMNT_0044022367 /DNA_START=71 /DNA_END=219 /DNA_ORIENTATION=+